MGRYNVVTSQRGEAAVGGTCSERHEQDVGVGVGVGKFSFRLGVTWTSVGDKGRDGLTVEEMIVRSDMLTITDKSSRVWFGCMTRA
jgi:hypothetical protein